MRQCERRLRALEQRRAAASSSGPGWVSVQSLAELPAELATSRRRCKVYVGCSPDDWDTEHEHKAAAEGA